MSLKNRIDFALLMTARHCNPNGDPTNNNHPRVDHEGYGEMSQECLKRKIRNRWQDAGENILLKADNRVDDGFYSIKDRLEGCRNLTTAKPRGGVEEEKFIKEVCKEWIDVRSFGAVLALKKDKSGESGVSTGIRGPVTIHTAKSLDVVDTRSIQITKSLNSETTKDGRRDSSTMGQKHLIDKGMYYTYGSVNTQLAKLTGFDESDAEKLKQALMSLFVNDESAARPVGSMVVHKLYWWQHNCPVGQYSPAKVFGSLKLVSLADPDDIYGQMDYPYYKAELESLPGLVPEIYEGW